MKRQPVLLAIRTLLVAVALVACGAPAQALRERTVYLVHVGDGGASGRSIGCGDSLVAVAMPVREDLPPLRGAIEALLAAAPAGHAPLRNPWYGQGMKLEEVGLRAGTATLRLSGTLVLAGVCDAPRLEEQIKATARQFRSVRTVRVLVNGRPLRQALR